MTTIHIEFNNNKEEIESYIDYLHAHFESTNMTQACLKMIDEYISLKNIAEITFNKEDARLFLGSTIASAFWIINKFVEDDCLFASELLENINLTKDELIYREIDMVASCPNIYKYFNFE